MSQVLEIYEQFRVPIIFFGGLFVFWGLVAFFYGRGNR